MTAATSTGELHAMSAFLAERRGAIRELQRQRERKVKGSREWRRLNRRIAGEHAKAREQADSWARETAREAVARSGVLAVEALNLVGMMTSAKGTEKEPGTRVAAKQALNRQLAEAALGRLERWMAVKAEEAGRRIWLVDAHYTSQQCAVCGHTSAANRPSRDAFRCTGCGHHAHADLNAAANIRRLGEQCEATWQRAGRPALLRRRPPLARHKGPNSSGHSGNGSGAGRQRPNKTASGSGAGPAPVVAAPPERG